MAWRSSGSSHAHLISNLKGEHCAVHLPVWCVAGEASVVVWWCGDSTVHAQVDAGSL